MTLEEHKCHISLKPTASLIQKPPLKLNCSRNSVRRGMWKSAWLSLESFTEEGTLEVQYEKLVRFCWGRLRVGVTFSSQGAADTLAKYTWGSTKKHTWNVVEWKSDVDMVGKLL